MAVTTNDCCSRKGKTLLRSDNMNDALTRIHHRDIIDIKFLAVAFKRIKLGFSRRGDAYSLWNDGKLIAVYRKQGGYPAGPLQLRLTNSAVRIHDLQVKTGKSR